MVSFSSKIFEEDSLTTDDYKLAAVVFSLVLAIVLLISKGLAKTEKQLAWSLSLFNSASLVICSLLYMYAKSDKIIPRVQTFQPIVDIFHDRNDFASLVAIWFTMVNFLDLLFGLMFYPKYLDLLTAWIHHPVYMYIMIFSVNGYGFITNCRPFSPTFVLACIEELPTFILALGTVNPSFRSDMGFGFSFFLTRVVYHASLFSYAVYSGADTPTFVFFGLALALHVFWFSNWITKYLFNSKDKPH